MPPCHIVTHDSRHHGIRNQWKGIVIHINRHTFSTNDHTIICHLTNTSLRSNSGRWSEGRSLCHVVGTTIWTLTGDILNNPCRWILHAKIIGSREELSTAVPYLTSMISLFGTIGTDEFTDERLLLGCQCSVVHACIITRQEGYARG